MRAWWVMLWLATALLCGFIVWDNAASQSVGTEAEKLYPAPERISNFQLELLSRSTVGIRTSGLPVPEDLYEDSLNDTIQYAIGPIEDLRLAMLFATEQRHDLALMRLISVEQGLREVLDEADPANRAAAEAWVEEIRADADIVQAFIPIPSSLLKERNLERLERRHGWFGTAARAGWMGEGSDDYTDYASSTTRTFIVAFIFVTLLVVGGLVGFVLCFTGVILVSVGKIRSGLQLKQLSTGTPRVAAFEAFVLFLIGFVAVRLSIEIAVKAQLVTDPVILAVTQFVLLWSLLAIVAWPAVRGCGWRNSRIIAGWTLPAPGGVLGFVKEIVFGIVGYLAGLPVMAIGILVALILIALTSSEPTHPAVNDIRSGGAIGIALTLILATVWAPVVEETVFRGMLYASLRGSRVIASLYASLISGFIFAVIHPQGVALVPALMSIGIVLAFIREWRGSIVGCITAHALHNGLLMSVLFFGLT